MNNWPVEFENENIRAMVERFLNSNDVDMRRAGLRAMAIAQKGAVVVTGQVLQRAMDEILAERKQAGK